MAFITRMETVLIRKRITNHFSITIIDTTFKREWGSVACMNKSLHYLVFEVILTFEEKENDYADS